MIQYLNGLWLDGEMVYSYEDAEPARSLVYGLMVPPKDLPHDKILLLGVCGNTTGKLIKNDYPEAELTLVDKEPQDKETIKADALEFVKSTKEHYDFVVVDLFENAQVSKLTFGRELYAELGRITDFVLVDIPTLTTLWPVYSDLFELVSKEQNRGNTVLLLKNNNI